MKLPTSADVKLLQDVEAELLRRRRKGTIGLIAGVAGALLPIIRAAVENKYPESIGQFLSNFIHPQVNTYQFIGTLVFVLGFGAYFIFRKTNLLLKESGEPFRYTFWIKRFEAVSGTPGARFTLKEDDRFNLLHHDLMERLNRRIRRLSLLDVDSLKSSPADPQVLRSHIDISGHYAIREERDGLWVIHVMPRIRIGPPGTPEALAHPVKYRLVEEDTKRSKERDSKAGKAQTATAGSENVLDAARYNRIVERVYSTIATEVYRQIESDVTAKVESFPTKYLRAVTLFHEAEDFARSNTVDAYDRALELYRESKRYFDIRFMAWVSGVLVRAPVLWRLAARSAHMEARARIGYCKCLIYRRVISALSGRNQNALFEIPEELKRATSKLESLHNRINRKWRIEPSPETGNQPGAQEAGYQYRTLMAFLTFPKDSPTKRARPVFDKQCKALFEAYLVAALGYFYLDSYECARLYLNKAKAVAPDWSQRNALWLMAAAETQFDLPQVLRYLRQATDLAPDFEIAQYRYAYYSEMRLRLRNEIGKKDRVRVKSVLERYDQALSLNPGNIGALASQGYLLWLLGDLGEARRKFDEGRELRTMVRQTFVGGLKYGLARIEAEAGDLNESYNLFAQAISSDPALAGYANAGSQILGYYEFISQDMLTRYEEFKTSVIARIEKASRNVRKKDREYDISEKTLDGVRSFVMNDYGNACLNYYHRFGARTHLREAISSYKESIKKNPENAAAYLNLSNAYAWIGEVTKSLECLEAAERLFPTWTSLLIEAIGNVARRIPQLLEEKKTALDSEIRKREGALQQKDEAQETVSISASDNQFSPGGDAKGGQTSEALNRSVQDPVGQRPGDLQNVEKERREKIDRLRQELNAIKDEESHRVFEKLKRVMDQTKLFSLYGVLNADFDGAGVETFLATKFETNKLDEGDVKALIAWAEILSNNVDKDEALRACCQLCSLIQKHYYPEDVATNRILYGVYQKLFEKAKGEADAKKIDAPINNWLAQTEACKKNIRSSIANWLTLDVTHYTSLTWARDFIAEEEFLPYLQRATDLIPDSDGYNYMLGNYKYEKGDYRAAVDAFACAIRTDSDNGLYYNSIGNAYFALADFQKAIDNYQWAVELASDDEVLRSNLDGARRELRLGLNAQGNEYLDRGEHRNAIAKYEEAIRVQPDDVIHSNLALGWEYLREDGTRIEALEKAIASLRKANELSPKNHNYAERIKRLEEKRSFAMRFGERVLDRVPLVTPVAVEVASNLVPYVATETFQLQPELNGQITDAREQIKNTMGVTIPAVRFRGSYGDLPGLYVILLNEVPVAMGVLSEEKRLFCGTSPDLTPLGVQGEETSDPLTGDAALWIDRKDWEKVEGSGHRLWGVIEYLGFHLEAVLRRNLVEFVGHQETVNMLDADSGLNQDAGETPADRSAFVAVLRGLLKEGVPITARKAIVDRFKLSRAARTDLVTLVEEVRSLPEIRPVLAGNDDRYVFHLIGPTFEQEIEAAINRNGSQPVLAMDLPTLGKFQTALSGLRTRVASERHVAVIVANVGLRPFVRQLIELELPNVPVLSRRELKTELERNIVDESGVEQSP